MEITRAVQYQQFYLMKNVAVVDGNIRRILTRVFNLNINDNLYDKVIRSISDYLTPKKIMEIIVNL